MKKIIRLAIRAIQIISVSVSGIMGILLGVSSYCGAFAYERILAVIGLEISIETLTIGTTALLILALLTTLILEKT